MEAFEQFVAVALADEGLVVSSGIKFPVRRQVRKVRTEFQTHGYEVDLVGARADKLVLASVKSFFGSQGVRSRDVTGDGRGSGLYRLLNDDDIRRGVVEAAAERYGFEVGQIHLRLYVGRWARTRGIDERHMVEEWGHSQAVGAGPIEVYDVNDVVEVVRRVAASRTYINDPVIVAMKVLIQAGVLTDSAASV